MKSADAVVQNILTRWKQETITLNEFRRALLQCGWTRHMIYHWLDRDADRYSQRALLGNRPLYIRRDKTK